MILTKTSGNGIGMKIIGGQPIPSLYDKVNRCIVTSGAFVTEVFQNSNVFFMDEIHEGKYHLDKIDIVSDAKSNTFIM